jgi:hypothetical protein
MVVLAVHVVVVVFYNDQFGGGIAPWRTDGGNVCRRNVERIPT